MYCKELNEHECIVKLVKDNPKVYEEFTTDPNLNRIERADGIMSTAFGQLDKKAQVASRDQNTNFFASVKPLKTGEKIVASNKGYFLYNKKEEPNFSFREGKFSINLT